MPMTSSDNVLATRVVCPEFLRQELNIQKGFEVSSSCHASGFDLSNLEPFTMGEDSFVE